MSLMQYTLPGNANKFATFAISFDGTCRADMTSPHSMDDHESDGQIAGIPLGQLRVGTWANEVYFVPCGRHGGES